MADQKEKVPAGIPTTAELASIVKSMEQLGSANTVIVGKLNAFAVTTKEFSKLKVDKSVKDNIKSLDTATKNIAGVGRSLRSMGDMLVSLVKGLDTTALKDSIELLSGDPGSLMEDIDAERMSSDNKTKLAGKIKKVTQNKKPGFFDVISTLLSIITSMNTLKAPRTRRFRREIEKCFIGLDDITTGISLQAKKLAGQGKDIKVFSDAYIVFGNFIETFSSTIQKISETADSVDKEYEDIQFYISIVSLLVTRFTDIRDSLMKANFSTKNLDSVKAFNSVVTSMTKTISDGSELMMFFGKKESKITSGINSFKSILDSMFSVITSMNGSSNLIKDGKKDVNNLTSIVGKLTDISKDLSKFTKSMVGPSIGASIELNRLKGIVNNIAYVLIAIPKEEELKKLDVLAIATQSLAVIGESLAAFSNAMKNSKNIKRQLSEFEEIVGLVVGVISTIGDSNDINDQVSARLKVIDGITKEMTNVSKSLLVFGIISTLGLIPAKIGLKIFEGEVKAITLIASSLKSVNVDKESIETLQELTLFIMMCGGVIAVSALVGILVVEAFKYVSLGFLALAVVIGAVYGIAQLLTTVKSDILKTIDAVEDIVEFILMCGAIVALSALVGILVVKAFKFVAAGFAAIVVVAGLMIGVAFVLQLIKKDIRDAAEAMFKIGLFFLLVGGVITVMALVGILVIKLWPALMAGFIAYVTILGVTLLFSLAVQKVFKAAMQGISEFGLLMLALAGTVVILILGSMLWKYADVEGLIAEILVMGVLLAAVVALCRFADQEFQTSWKGALAMLILLGGMAAIATLMIVASNMIENVNWPVLIAMWVNLGIMLGSLIVVAKLVEKNQKSMLIGLGILVGIGASMIAVGFGLKQLVDAMTPEPDWSVFGKIFVTITSFLGMALGIGLLIGSNPFGVAIGGFVLIGCGLLAAIGATMASIGLGLRQIGEAAPFADTAKDAIPKIFGVVEIVCDNIPDAKSMLKAQLAAITLNTMIRPVARLAEIMKDLAEFKVPVKWDKDGKPTEYRHIDNSDIDRANSTVTTLLTGFIGIFGDEGVGKGLDKLEKTKRSTIKKLKMIMSLTDSIKDLVEVIEKLSNLSNIMIAEAYDEKTGKPTKFRRFDVTSDLVKVGESITTLVTGFITNVTSAIESSNIEDMKKRTIKKTEMIMSLAQPVSTILDMVKTLAEGKVQKYGENGEPLKDQYETLKDWIKKLETENPIQNLINSFVRAITSIDYSQVKQIEHREDAMNVLEGQAKNIKELISSITGVTKEIDTNLTNWSMDGDFTKIQTALISLLKATYVPITNPYITADKIKEIKNREEGLKILKKNTEAVLDIVVVSAKIGTEISKITNLDTLKDDLIKGIGAASNAIVSIKIPDGVEEKQKTLLYNAKYTLRIAEVTADISGIKFADPSFSNLSTALKNLFDATNNITDSIIDDAPKKLGVLNAYAKYLERLSAITISPRLGSNVERASNSSMKLMKTINGMDDRKLGKFADISKNMARFSTSIRGNFDGLAKAMNENIITALEKVDKSMKELKTYLETMPGQLAGAVGGAISSATINVEGTDKKKDTAPKVKPRHEEKTPDDKPKSRPQGQKEIRDLPTLINELGKCISDGKIKVGY